MSTEMTVFKEFETGLATLEESNAGMEFDDTPEGIADRRQWYKKLRKASNALDNIRKDAGAEYLRLGREVNSEAKSIQVRLDVMEKPHKDALDAIEAAEQKVIDDLAAAAEKEKAEAEEKRLADLAEREAKAQAIIDAAEKKEREAKSAHEAAEREKQIEADKLTAVEQAKRNAAEQAARDKIAIIAKAKQDSIDAANKAEEEKQEAIMQERRIAHEKENNRIAQELAEKNKQAEIDAKESARVADVEHREDIEKEFAQSIVDECLHISPDHALLVLDAIKAGKIKHVQIVY